MQSNFENELSLLRNETINKNECLLDKITILEFNLCDEVSNNDDLKLKLESFRNDKIKTEEK